MCVKSDNFLNCCDQSMHRVLQERYSGCDVTYSVCDVRYSCVFMKAVALISLYCYDVINTLCVMSYLYGCDVIMCSCVVICTIWVI